MTNQQTPFIAQTLNPNTVVGRISGGVGDAESIPIPTLAALINAQSSDVSSTSNTIGLGNLSFTLSTGKAFVAGQFILIAAQGSTTNYVAGQIVSYNSVTGALVVNSLVDGGSGTFTNWVITVSGAVGEQGPTGTSIPEVAAGGSADTITATFSPAIGSLTDQLLVGVVIASANATATPTLNANGLGAKTITRYNGQPLMAGDLPGSPYLALFCYHLSDTTWTLLNPANPTPLNIPIPPAYAQRLSGEA